MRLLPPAVHVFKHHAWSIGHSQGKVGDVLARQVWCDVTHVEVHWETAYALQCDTAHDSQTCQVCDAFSADMCEC